MPDLPRDFFPPVRGEPSEEVEERYRIKAFLGSGGFAKVYVVYDEELEQDVAYKVLHPWYANDEEFVERFRREARNAAKVRSHPNVVSVYDRGVKEDGTYYMVMEYLPGGALEDLLAREGPLPVRRALEVTLRVADALSEAHERGVIHRDIKPENVLLSKRGEAKVTDFGITKAADASTKLSRPGFSLGTALHVPGADQGRRGDFQERSLCLGVVLYKMLAGKLPFDGKTIEEIRRKHFRERVSPLEEMNPNVEVPERVEAVTMRLLAKDPEERYPDAAALIDELKRVLRSLENVEVPTLTGRHVSRVRSTLTDMGLTLGEQKEAPSETRPEGEIVGQSPEAGTMVKPGSPISVTVSSGPSTVEVPALAGLDRSEASSTLAAAGLKLGTQNQAPSDTALEGEIIGQYPLARTKAERGSSVSVTVSSGPQKASTTERRDHSSGRTLIPAADTQLAQLLKEKIIFLGTPVDDQVANAIMAQLLHLESEDPEQDINLYRNSPGGNVSAGLAIYDTMQFVKPDIVTTALGMAASMGAFLLAAGTKGKRNALPDTRILLLQPSVGRPAGQASDVQIHAEELIQTKRRLNEILADNTGQPYEKLLRNTERDYIMGPDEAIEYSVIDNIVRQH